MGIPLSADIYEGREISVIELLSLGNDIPNFSPSARANRALMYGADRGNIEGRQSPHVLCEDGTEHVLGDRVGLRTANPLSALDIRGVAGIDLLHLVGSDGSTKFAVTDAGGISGALSFSGAQTISLSSLGTTSTNGLILTNPTAAAAGAQQISPRIRWTGQGWKTDATAASQAVDYIAQLVPVQGAANPQARLDFRYQINAGGYQASPTMSLLNDNVGIGTVSPGAKLQVNATGAEPSTLLRLSNIGATGTNYNFIMNNDGVRQYLQLSDSSSGASGIVLNTAGNVGIWTTSGFGTSAAKVLSLGAGTDPTTSPADVAQLWAADVNAEAGKASLMLRSEITANGNGAVTGAFIKTSTGDFAAGYEGMVEINTVDNVAKIWADGAWRTIASGWV